MRFREILFFRTFDCFKKLKTRNYFYEFKKIISQSRTDIISYQMNKLNRLLNYANQNSEYYKKIFSKIPDYKINDNPLEILERIPPLTREIIQNNISDIVIKKSKEKLFKGSSSGTTGEPISYYHDVCGESAGIASGFLQWYMSGWKIGMKGIHIWGNLDSIKYWNSFGSKTKRFLQNVIYIPSPLFNDYSQYPDLINKINNAKPGYIDGYSSSIFRLAKYVEENNIRFRKVKYVFTTAENLPDYQRETINKYIGNVFDTYGCGEINGIAAQVTGSDKYFIIEPRVLVELGNKIGDYYEIVITDLDNLFMPFIKYKPGDLIDGLYFEENEKFPLKYFKKIVGRTADVIELKNGKIILPVNLIGGTFIRHFKSISRHKVKWNGTKMHFLFESGEFIPDDAVKSKLDEMLSEYEVPYSFEIVNEILPGKNGKHTYFEKINC